jgi:hypothetical protein
MVLRMQSLQLYRFFRRIDAAIHAFRMREVHWDKNGLPYEIKRGTRGAFQKEEIPTVLPNWGYELISWVGK